jgi:hypothetical protein
MRLLTTLTVVGIVCLSAAKAGAGDVPANLHGATVRVTPHQGSRIVGTLTDISDTSLSVLSDSGPKVLPRDSIRKLEWRDADGHPVLRSTLLTGALVGVFGLILKPSTFGTESDVSDRPFCTSRPECAAKLFGGGAVIGAIGGLAIRSPVWRRVPVASVHAAVRPMPAGLTAALTIGW